MPAPPIENIPAEYVNNAWFEVIRPFGSSSTNTFYEGTIVDAMPCGRFNTGGNVQFTHILYCSPYTDIKDNLSRFSGNHAFIYSDGDEVRVYNHLGYERFVVVYVTYIPDGTTSFDSASGYKVAYLFRHSVVIV